MPFCLDALVFEKPFAGYWVVRNGFMMPRFRPCAKKQGLDAEDVNKAHLEPSMVKSARPGGKLIDLGESRPLNRGRRHV